MYANDKVDSDVRLNAMSLDHAGHARKASRISKAAVDNCGNWVGNFYLS